MPNYYSGKYRPKNPLKYEGDPSDIVYRSLWERGAFKWADMNPDVISWGSETVVIPYVCRTDGKPHRYFMDLKLTFRNGQTILVEIKPEAQTKRPPRPKRKNKRYLTESLRFIKNASKWEAAQQFCQERDWKFQIWTEKTLQRLGIKV